VVVEVVVVVVEVVAMVGVVVVVVVVVVGGGVGVVVVVVAVVAVATGATTLVALDVALVDPFLLLAVIDARRVDATSGAPSLYVDALALAIGMHAPPDALHRSH